MQTGPRVIKLDSLDSGGAKRKPLARKRKVESQENFQFIKPSVRILSEDQISETNKTKIYWALIFFVLALVAVGWFFSFKHNIQNLESDSKGDDLGELTSGLKKNMEEISWNLEELKDLAVKQASSSLSQPAGSNQNIGQSGPDGVPAGPASAPDAANSTLNDVQAKIEELEMVLNIQTASTADKTASRSVDAVE